ncbi:efflux RND transporter permease subunit [Massilia sp. P8910]|uniref:efflux RND transporter permease subunit n=1 Tax=Massilia antarctica TaxID=2765360 RepID=UPI0006BB9788|nr:MULTISPECIES: efflux RND transporter permease subunit [Massilia]MCE3604242.1 efflux RND transporter permease subunit [Massilia antarctica]MCY0914416.1 efflux RND transporter permease subunit [Massilia sp. H27-R4]CUI03204.1 RND efflux system, inner membrane transporter CmeB [Janthinobacterium sp. CG23_2]CUU26990.1 RND efflux system, inner membrane transporter CmeB [Janthinobacterium sp. CG23_2]
MNFSRFFIDRPIFAAVLSIIVFVAGLLSIFKLPISEYPDVVPPSVVVRAQYPGANPKVIAETVAAPLEEQINGVENMLYMSSQNTSDGSLTLTVTFKVGTNVEQAESQVQNRIQRALPRLPEEVRQIGVTAVKSSPNLTMVVHLVSPTGRYDDVYLRNYAVLNVKDQLARIQGMGETQLFGAGDYAMRVWLDPQKVAARGMTASDIVAAVREQNVQVAAGVIGASPSKGSEFQLTVNTQGRLTSVEEFGDIIVRTGTDGAITHLRDVARIELGSNSYSLRSLLNNKSAAAIAIFEAPGANALQLSADVRAKMAELKKDFPEGVDFSVVYDPTQFVQESIKAVIHTLLEAVALVVLVVIIFLQTWRASIIPLLAVPVSIIGTFAVMLGFGFSINTLSLFGLVLAIGIVVDDAIVVVENVERNIQEGLSPRDATVQAMKEVSGPIIAIALVLCAVFVPIAFVAGLSGQFYRQFALTIAISTVISAFSSLTLSPALAAALLKPHHAPKDGLTRVMDKLFGGFFAWFNRFFGRASTRYEGGVNVVLKRKGISLVVYAVLAVAAVFMFKAVPSGFVPAQDKQYLVGFAQLPDAASLDRTDTVIRKMSEIAAGVPGVESSVAFPGLSINGFTNAPNSGIVFFTLKPFDKRTGKGESGPEIAQEVNKRLGAIQDAFIMVFPPPPVNGLGTIGGFKMMLEDRGNVGYDELYKASQAMQMKAWQNPQLAGVFSSFQINVPQLFADVDRVKAKQLGVPLQTIYQTLQINLGSLYVNDFNQFGRTYQVRVQADAPFRSQADQIAQLKVRNDKGEMIPLSSLMRVKDTYGPDRVQRYNAYVSADMNGGPAPGVSSGQAQAALEKIAAEVLPKGVSYEWTELTYQEILSGNTMVLVFPLCVLLVFLVLAAQYESWTLPLAVILIVPMSILCALIGVKLTGGDNNIFTQIALFVLVGLASKNAILIVEFARELEDHGRTIVEAALEACRLRLRPILMTSIAFIMGVVPLVFSSGAGAEMRHAMGVAVFGGMLGVTFFGLFLTPVFYVLLRTFAKKMEKKSSVAVPAHLEGAV